MYNTDYIDYWLPKTLYTFRPLADIIQHCRASCVNIQIIEGQE